MTSTAQVHGVNEYWFSPDKQCELTGADSLLQLQAAATLNNKSTVWLKLTGIKLLTQNKRVYVSTERHHPVTRPEWHVTSVHLYSILSSHHRVLQFLGQRVFTLRVLLLLFLTLHQSGHYLRLDQRSAKHKQNHEQDERMFVTEPWSSWKHGNGRTWVFLPSRFNSPHLGFLVFRLTFWSIYSLILSFAWL